MELNLGAGGPTTTELFCNYDEMCLILQKLQVTQLQLKHSVYQINQQIGDYGEWANFKFKWKGWEKHDVIAMCF